MVTDRELGYVACVHLIILFIYGLWGAPTHADQPSWVVVAERAQALRDCGFTVLPVRLQNAQSADYDGTYLEVTYFPTQFCHDARWIFLLDDGYFRSLRRLWDQGTPILLQLEGQQRGTVVPRGHAMNRALLGRLDTRDLLIVAPEANYADFMYQYAHLRDQKDGLGVRLSGMLKPLRLRPREMAVLLRFVWETRAFVLASTLRESAEYTFYHESPTSHRFRPMPPGTMGQIYDTFAVRQHYLTSYARPAEDLLAHLAGESNRAKFAAVVLALAKYVRPEDLKAIGVAREVPHLRDAVQCAGELMASSF